MKQKTEQSTEKPEGEDLMDWWMVPDMFMFENVGFSNTVGIYKYLTCADCEQGPVGIHNLELKKSYVAAQRIDYKS